MKWLSRRRPVWHAVVGGSFVLANVSLVAVLLASFSANSAPHTLRAMSAHGTERKTLATVPLDGGMEAVVTLDNLSGEMTGLVLDRFTGKFFLEYRRNVFEDFPLARDRRPRFSLVAGSADFRQFSENERMGQGVVFVSEDGSGKVVAYGLPWNTQFRTNLVGPQSRPFIPLDFAETRRLAIRE